jgi:hypothetical protein
MDQDQQTPAQDATPDSSLAPLVAALQRIEALVAKRPAVQLEYGSEREAAAMFGTDVVTFRKAVKKHGGPARVYITSYGKFHLPTLREWARSLPAKSFNPPPPPPKKAKVA